MTAEYIKSVPVKHFRQCQISFVLLLSFLAGNCQEGTVPIGAFPVSVAPVVLLLTGYTPRGPYLQLLPRRPFYRYV